MYCWTSPHNFLESRKIITTEIYCKKLLSWNKKLLLIHPRLVNTRWPIIVHDYARPHVSVITSQNLRELSNKGSPPPAYSSDRSSTDYHIFKYLDSFLREMLQKAKLSSKCVQSVHELQKCRLLYYRIDNIYKWLAKLYWLYLIWWIKCPRCWNICDEFHAWKRCLSFTQSVTYFCLNLNMRLLIQADMSFFTM